MKAVVLLPDRDSPRKRDWTSAFLPEAKTFARIFGAQLSQIDVSKSPIERMRQSVQAIKNATPPIEIIGIFCHGWTDGIQIGWQRRNLKMVVEEIAPSCSKSLHVVLYCCSTGSTDTGAPGGEGGFADSLRDALCRAGLVDCQVDAHDTPGHTTRNPRVRRFRGQGSPVGGQGGQWIVEPGKGPLWKAWVTALRGGTDLRLRYSALNVGQIHEGLIRLA